MTSAEDRPTGHPPRRASGNVGDFADDVEIPDPDFLKGRWVTSYSGFLHVLPTPTEFKPTTPPQVPGYSYFPDTEKYEQREGYFVFAAMACIYFDGHGNLSGHVEANRGGKDHRSYPVTGSYALQWNPNLHVYDGTFTTVQGGGPDGHIDMTHHFVMTNRDEMEWVWTSSNYRGFVTHGTLTRVNAQW